MIVDTESTLRCTASTATIIERKACNNIIVQLCGDSPAAKHHNSPITQQVILIPETTPQGCIPYIPGEASLSSRMGRGWSGATGYAVAWKKGEQWKGVETTWDTTRTASMRSMQR